MCITYTCDLRSLFGGEDYESNDYRADSTRAGA